mgnify:CR=1 FL=1
MMYITITLIIIWILYIEYRFSKTISVFEKICKDTIELSFKKDDITIDFLTLLLQEKGVINEKQREFFKEQLEKKLHDELKTEEQLIKEEEKEYKDFLWNHFFNKLNK